MRRNAAVRLNKSDSQNTLTCALVFKRRGELRDGTFESQFYRCQRLLIDELWVEAPRIAASDSSISSAGIQ